MNKFIGRIVFSGLLFVPFVGLKAQSSGFEIIKGVDLMEDVFNKLDQYYVDEPKFGDMSKTAIDAMLKQLDPYTVYYHESNMEDYMLMTTGSYGGIGAIIRKIGDYVDIAEPYEGKPAFNAGLRAGDKILAIDGHDMKGMAVDEVSKKLKGPQGSDIQVKFERNGVEKTVNFKRDKIDLPVVPYYGMLNKTVGYVSLNTFLKQTVTDEVKKAILDLKNQGMKQLIIDLRGNGGGFLNQAVSLVNLFVDKGITVVQTKGRLQSEVFDYKTENEPLDKTMPLVVLVDKNSASASEIFAGSMQDLDRAVIVGRTSFGKGLVQRTYNLRYGAKIKLTVAKYYTNSGRCVQKLEYYDKNYGDKVKEIPDSLLKTFHTKNGRPVIDGRGIEPDIHVDLKDISDLTVNIILNNLAFNYANKFVTEHDTIAAPDKFHLTDAEYDEFKQMVIKDTFDYQTASEAALLDLKKIAEKEGYFNEIQNPYEKMLKELTPSKARDLEKFKDEIKQVVEDEIVSRYYFQKGRAIYDLQDNDDIKRAIEVLENPTEYKKILNIK